MDSPVKDLGLSPQERLRFVAEGVLISVLTATDARIAAHPSILAASEQLLEDFLEQTEQDGMTERILDMPMFYVRFIVNHYLNAWRTGYMRGFKRDFL